jgi:hypothetical protein
LKGDFIVKKLDIEDRRSKVNDALAISLLDADPPTPQTMELVEQYIYGSISIEDITQIIFDQYSK